MSMYRKEWGCCGSITETDAWEPEDCPFCKPLAHQAEPVEPVATLTAQRDALLEALKTYGWHTEDCPQYPTHARPKNWPACTCGFDAAIKAVEEGK